MFFTLFFASNFHHVVFFLISIFSISNLFSGPLFLRPSFFVNQSIKSQNMHVTKKHCSPASFPQLSSYLSFLSFSPSFHFRIIYIYTFSHVCIVLNELFPRLFLLLSLTRSLSLPLSISLFLSLSNTLSLSLFPLLNFFLLFLQGEAQRGLERLASDGGLTASQRPSWG